MLLFKPFVTDAPRRTLRGREATHTGPCPNLYQVVGLIALEHGTLRMVAMHAGNTEYTVHGGHAEYTVHGSNSAPAYRCHCMPHGYTHGRGQQRAQHY